MDKNIKSNKISTNMNNELERETLSLSVEMLRNFGSLIKSKEYFMISELIDNSLSSYIAEKQNSDGLIVEINYTKGIENKNNKISITDNAFGIDKNMIKEVLTPGGNKNNKNSELNNFGMGLKQAAFWSGERLSLLTKKDDSSTFNAYIDLKESDEINKGNVVFVVNKDNRNIKYYTREEESEHGTQIEISDLHNGKYNKLPEMIKEFKEGKINSIENIMSSKMNDHIIIAIYLKYERYIEKGMKIIFSFVDETNNKNIEFIEFSNKNDYNFKIKPEYIGLSFQKHIEKKIKKNVDKKNDQITSLEYIDSQIDEFIEWLKIRENKKWKPEYDEEFREILENKEKPLYDTLYFDVKKFGIDKEPIKVRIGYMSLDYSKKLYSKFRGFSVFQKNRAIHCGPNESESVYKDIHIGNWSPITQSIITRDSDFNYRKVFGSFDIDLLLQAGILELDTNKTGFYNSNNTTKDFLKEFKEQIWDPYTQKWGLLFKGFEEWRSEKSETKLLKDNEIKDAMFSMTASSNLEVEDIFIIDEQILTRQDVEEKYNKSVEDLQNEKNIVLEEVTSWTFNLSNILNIDENKKICIYLKQINDDAYGKPWNIEEKININSEMDKSHQISNWELKINMNSILLKPVLPNIDDYDKKDNTVKKAIMQTIYKIVLVEALVEAINKKTKYSEMHKIPNDFWKLSKHFNNDLGEIKRYFIREIFLKNNDN